MFEDGEVGEICLLPDLSLALEIDHHWVDHLEMNDSEMITSEGMALDEEKQVFEMILEVEMISEEEMMISEETEREMITMMIEEFEMNQCLKWEDKKCN